jgi:hypothetical protein
MGSAARYEELESTPRLTGHAATRMGSRRISHDDVANVMSYGRCYHVRGAVVYALGHRESELWRKEGLRLERIEGLQVICAAEDYTVITVYRNNDFSSLRRRNTRWSPKRSAVNVSGVN